MSSKLYLHIGYPKTATTTLQMHLFSNHNEINYLGKYLPDHDYTKPELKRLINNLINEPSHLYDGEAELHYCIQSEIASSNKPITLISNEAFLHPWAVDIRTVALRAYNAFYPCKIIIVIREQVDALRSFYRAHGRYGQYLFMQLSSQLHSSISFPLSPEKWLEMQSLEFNKNVSSTLMYSEVIKCYQDIFGADNILVLCYEQLSINPNDYIRSISEWLNIDACESQSLLAGKRENCTDTRQSSESSDECMDKSAFISAFPEEMIRRYKEENVALSNMLNIDLSSYGYLL